MIILGILLCPVSIIGIYKLNDFTTKNKFLYRLLMYGVSLLYLLVCLFTNIEPFDFETISTSDYFVKAALVFIFSPVLWIDLYYICSKIIRKHRVKKNSKLRTKEQYVYYRDDLNKISPSMIMFTSKFDIDFKSVVSSVILKLKLTGYIKEKGSKWEIINKDTDELLESEKMILRSLKTKTLDEKEYYNVVKDECINKHYVKRNKNKALKIIKIILCILIPIMMIKSSMKFDRYVFDNYQTYVYDGVRYYKIQEYDGDIHYGKTKDSDNYHHGYIYENGKKTYFYDKAYLRVDRYQYEEVRIPTLYHVLDVAYVFISVLSPFVFLFVIIIELKYFNKEYRRTTKGNQILNEAYGLKNYLKDFTLMSKRKESELILYEYYLIYSTLLDVNPKLRNELIKKYYNL